MLKRNGSHAVEVIATQGKYEDRKPAMFNVSTPEPGTPAWSQAGPEASRTNRVAVTPTGDLIEVGQTVIGGSRPVAARGGPRASRPRPSSCARRPRSRRATAAGRSAGPT